MRRRGLPLADAPLLAGAARRSTRARHALTAVLAAVVAASVATAAGSASRQVDTPQAASNTEIVLDLSGSIAGVTVPPIARALRTIERSAGSNGTVGLVLFSDTAEEALPPGTPARELRPFIRFFTPLRGSTAGSPPRLPVNPWSAGFSGGTKISAGLVAAREALERDRVGGRLVLISDLADGPGDAAAVRSELVRDLRDPRLSVSVVALPTGVLDQDQGQVALYRSLLGRQAVTPRYPPPPRASEAGATAGFPGNLVGAALIAALALAAFELAAVALRWREER